MVVFNVIFYAFIAVVCVQIYYYTVVFGRFSALKTKKAAFKTPPVSVIVCAKNEADNLKRNIPFLLSQEYPEFELILINDNSSDHTLKVMTGFQKLHENIKIVNVKPVEAFWGNKKYALTLGIKAATHETLLFTDADCSPNSSHWIAEMCVQFDQERLLVLGYGAYEKIKRSFLNRLIRFETFFTAVQYFSYATTGNAYMGVGRNLAYKRSLFFEANGFIGHIQVKSGDDDLFVNQVATKLNTAICVSEHAFTSSKPKTDFKSWILQKRRHVSTASHYKTKHKLMLGLFYVSQILFWILGTTVLILMLHWEIAVALIALRFAIQYMVLFAAAKKLNEKDLIFLLPVLEVFLFSAQMVIFIQNLISKPKYWK
ncbi:glycosyltransferase [Subsaximicrobium wynnwilliamsii]|uniref:Glycosyltransferase n=1 Tax=Subsaximicrobium wynnwilliamsii TaxID=291179 RepID=A0A5C6ZKJ3_9FLAO|nr:glycosyltransferase [Subsaximicrobium wynnwilliamsii]TXD90322.1 glycosyltransferase [Subsaximicrobium wynnwilliamsii]TXE04373.1 glycosyltransferase [Subsaximicrobium wynnwilliamsii]